MLRDDAHIRVAALQAPVVTLGPGSRFVVWVQGCCFDCPGCTSPRWRSFNGGMIMTVDAVSRIISRTPGIEGVTISGGEPMLQSGALARLVRCVRHDRPLSVICYTGFELKTLKTERKSSDMSLISLCDVLIDGPYIAAMDDNRGLRGSSNQQVHFITDRYAGMKEMFVSGPRRIQLGFDGDELLAAGVPPQGFARDLDLAIHNHCGVSASQP